MHLKLADTHATAPSRIPVILAATMLAAMSLGIVPASGAEPQNGFKTKQPAMLEVGPNAPADMEIKPILTVGDTIGGYRFEAIPDGISFLPAGNNAATVFVNHETSTVPFNYVLPPTASNSQNDFDNSQVSKLVLRNGGAILSASYVIPSSANYQRFCSNFLGTTVTGFSRPILFNNEEGIDWIMESGTAWPAAEGATGARQIGVAVAYDVNAGAYKTIWGMGRLNHENNVGIPGYGKPVLLSGDDAFVSNPAQSQVYAYIANDADAVWNDTGDLWAFVPSEANATVNDYYDFPMNSTMSISGEFIKVPRNIAAGKNPDGTEMMAEDVPFDPATNTFGPYDEPPTDGTWQRPPGTPQSATTIPGIDGPQWVLEQWGDDNNVFQFIRIEDIATDKRPGMSNVVYLADSGRGATSPGFANGVSLPNNAFTSSNGRIWKMVMDPTYPTKVTSLSILIEGDDNAVKTLNEIHQPDNLETTENALYVTEDPGSSQQFTAAQQAANPANATTGRVWQYKFSSATSTTGTLAAVLKVDQSADQGPTDDDGALAAGNWGAWESTGIIDVSSIFGPGKFLVNVQAHTLWVDKADGPGILPPAGADWTVKREGGQLLLVTIPGG